VGVGDLTRGGSESDAEEIRHGTSIAGCRCSTAALARATTTFAQKNIGDVHLTWENESHTKVKEADRVRWRSLFPPISVLAQAGG